MLLKDGWYSAIWSNDIGQAPVARTVCNEKLVLFRTESGQVVALEDRCCHRAAPLSLGKVIGDNIVCGYHGLKFAPSGICVEVPGRDHVPQGAVVRSYPAVEKGAIIWVWLGDQNKANPTKIPDLPWLDSPGWTKTPGYIHLKANYLLLIDNLLDVTHVAYLHENTLFGDPKEATEPAKVVRLEDGIRVERWLINVNPPPIFARASGFDGKVDRWQIITWKAPSTVYLDIGCAKTGTGAPQGDRSQGISIWSNHLMAPETDTTTHYQYGYARNFLQDDQEMSHYLREGTRAAFLQDVEMLEAQQTNVAGGAIGRRIDLWADAGQIQARRMLGNLIQAAESAPS
jgi:phenylpropionate dioxygenase-like ring-hydroxylating dioxygenase large terminal subunit